MDYINLKEHFFLENEEWSYLYIMKLIWIDSIGYNYFYRSYTK